MAPPCDPHHAKSQGHHQEGVMATVTVDTKNPYLAGVQSTDNAAASFAVAVQGVD